MEDKKIKYDLSYFTLDGGKKRQKTPMTPKSKKGKSGTQTISGKFSTIKSLGKSPDNVDPNNENVFNDDDNVFNGKRERKFRDLVAKEPKFLTNRPGAINW